jgi:hypothetical protein
MSQFRTPRRQRQRELDERRAAEADIKHRHYVRPYGNRGLHVVKATVDGAEYIVSGPGRTFQPGTVVPTGSNTGNQGETILSDPVPGRRGAGLYAPTTITKRQCPACLTGRRYIGITDSGSTDVVQAWEYLDNALISLLDTASLPAELQTSGGERFEWTLVSDTTVAFIATDTSNDDRVVIWHLGGSLGLMTPDSGSDLWTKLLWTGDSLWVAEEVGSGENQVKVYRGFPVIGGDLDQVANINVSGFNTIDPGDMAIAFHQPYVWSDQLDELPPAEDTRWVGDGTDNFGPPILDQGSNAGGGQMVGSGAALVGHGPTPASIYLISSDLTEQRITPTGWSLGSRPKLAVSNPGEYSVSISGGFVRLPLKDYSDVNTSNCGTPGLPLAGPSGLSLKAFLPI